MRCCEYMRWCASCVACPLSTLARSLMRPRALARQGKGRDPGLVPHERDAAFACLPPGLAWLSRSACMIDRRETISCRPKGTYFVSVFYSNRSNQQGRRLTYRTYLLQGSSAAPKRSPTYLPHMLLCSLHLRQPCSVKKNQMLSAVCLCGIQVVLLPHFAH